MAWKTLSPISFEKHKRVVLKRADWVVKDGQHVHRRLSVIADVLQGPGQDDRLWRTVLLWPRDNETLTAADFCRAAESLGLTRGARYRGTPVANEAGAIGLHLRWPVKNEPVYLDCELTEDDIARVLDPEFDAVAPIPLDPAPEGWKLATTPLRKSRFIHVRTNESVIMGDQVLPDGPYCRTVSMNLGSNRIDAAAAHLWRVVSTFFGVGATVHVMYRGATRGHQTLTLAQSLDGSEFVGFDDLLIEPAAVEAFARRAAGN